MDLDPKNLKEIILKSEQPLLFKNFLKWNMLKWDIEKWKTVFGNEELQFRCGTNDLTFDPQWERTTSTVKGTFSEFLMFSDPKKWLYFDYKYLKEWFLKNEDLRNGISFKEFGFEDFSSSDATIWIGNKGAHTSCHMDTFGCNLVFQIFGRKQWLLFPPEEDLQATRIPYEESSIYSRLNFFSPLNLSDFKDIKNARKIILEPGDVLLVPHKWWHFVENLEVSISINIWIPLPMDQEEKVKETIIQLLISKLVKNLPTTTRDQILNPNCDDVCSIPLKKYVDILTYLKNEIKTENNQVQSSNPGNDLVNHEFIQKFSPLSEEEFNEVLLNQRRRFSSTEAKPKKQRNFELNKLINAITDSNVIELIKNNFLK